MYILLGCLAQPDCSGWWLASNLVAAVSSSVPAAAGYWNNHAAQSKGKIIQLTYDSIGSSVSKAK